MIIITFQRSVSPRRDNAQGFPVRPTVAQKELGVGVAEGIKIYVTEKIFVRVWDAPRGYTRPRSKEGTKPKWLFTAPWPS